VKTTPFTEGLLEGNHGIESVSLEISGYPIRENVEIIPGKFRFPFSGALTLREVPTKTVGSHEPLGRRGNFSGLFA